MDELQVGIISGLISSLIILVATAISNRILRKKIEKSKIYELEYIGKRDVCAPPEYPRETIYIEPPYDESMSEEFYEMSDIVKLTFPFDIKEIRIYEHQKLVYPTDDIEFLPANEPIYVNCKLTIGEDSPAFVVKCKTFMHEYREYEYKTIYKYSGGFSKFGLVMSKQTFVR